MRLFLQLCLFLFGLICYVASKPMTEDAITPRRGDLIWWPTDDGKGVRPAFISSNNLKFLKNDIEDYEAQHEDINFYLYNKHKDEMKIIYLDDERSLFDSHFDFDAPIRFITHGFNSNANGIMPYVTEYLKRDEIINVILIDWGKLATTLWYNVAAGHTITVGQKTAKFIEFLVLHGVKLEEIHVQGHSLGAHVAGITGHSLTIGKLERINALDPVKLLFENRPDSERIDPTDAKFVAVQHTSDLLAFTEPRGHVDFYPNGAGKQPGCGLDPADACSHIRAQAYMVESIMSPLAFRSCRCDSWEDFLGNCGSVCPQVQYMGVETDSNARGIYYLKTNADTPYGLG